MSGESYYRSLTDKRHKEILELIEVLKGKITNLTREREYIQNKGISFRTKQPEPKTRTIAEVEKDILDSQMEIARLETAYTEEPIHLDAPLRLRRKVKYTDDANIEIRTSETGRKLLFYEGEYASSIVEVEVNKEGIPTKIIRRIQNSVTMGKVLYVIQDILIQEEPKEQPIIEPPKPLTVTNPSKIREGTIDYMMLAWKCSRCNKAVRNTLPVCPNCGMSKTDSDNIAESKGSKSQEEKGMAKRVKDIFNRD